MEECSKHSDCMERIHNNINDIKLQNAKQEGLLEGFTKSVNDFLGSIRKDVYSPGGIVEKVGSHANQIALQWGLLAVVVVAVIIEWVVKK